MFASVVKSSTGKVLENGSPDIRSPFPGMASGAIIVIGGIRIRLDPDACEAIARAFEGSKSPAPF